MKKILCPTDFSHTALNAIAYAAEFAQTVGYDLTLLHVQTLLDLVPSDVSSKERLFTLEDLKAQSIEVSTTFRIQCNVILEPSFQQLSSIIKEKAADYDLVIMGSNGPDDLLQLSVGSNAYKAAISTNIPLLMIPTDCSYQSIDKIVYAFDYLSKGELPISKLADFAKSVNAEITVLQVMEEVRSQDADKELMELQTIILNSVSENLPLKFDTIRANEVAQSINNYMSKERSAILAVCSIHMNMLQRVFHRSVIKNIVATSNCPVLIFHE